MNRVEDKVVIVTGGASGIGAETVRLLAKEGAKVLIADINEDNGIRLVRELEAEGYPVLFSAADVRLPQENERLVKVAVEHFGKVDAIVCAAGRLYSKSIIEYEPEEWMDCIAVNLDAAYYLYRYAAPEMVKAGGGSCVFLGDGCMEMPLPKMGGNLTAKMGLFYLCRQIGVEHARENIRANIISPTLVESPYWDAAPAMLEVIRESSNAGHTFKPQDVASSIVFLVSDESNMITVSNVKANDNFDCGFAYDQWAGLRQMMK